jgi:dihydrofolate synthase/folylpolyglutamate synthase
LNDYEVAIDWLYHLEAKRGMEFRLEPIRSVLARLGDPHRATPCIHIAGTNGKGSTAAMLHSIYRETGLRVGLYTSPHLLSFRERIRVDRRFIREEEVVSLLQEIQQAMDVERIALTFFEIATIMAFLQFSAARLDLAVVEVGLGGRLDATNVIDGICAVITSIGYDHCAFLGDSLAQIAREKAGIVRASAPLVTGRLCRDAELAIAEIVAERGTRWLHYGRDYAVHGRNEGGESSLAGPHQRRNTALVNAVVDVLKDSLPVAEATRVRGLARVRWPGRLEELAKAPRIIVDCAHNPEAAACLRDALATMSLPRPRILVFGAMRDKDWSAMLAELVPNLDHVVLVPVNVARTFDPFAARDACPASVSVEVAGSAHDGLNHARRIAGTQGSIVVAGSIFLVAELYRACGGREDPFECHAPS